MLHILIVLQQAGWAVLPILAASIVSLAIILDSAWFLSRSEKSFQAYMMNPAGAERMLFGKKDLFASLLQWQLTNPSADQDTRNRSAEILFQAHERKIGWLSTIAAIAPLLGLLGTVAGMIHIFGLVALTRPDNPLTQLSSGISEALVSTLGGIVVAIIAALGHQYLVNRLDSFGAQTEGFVAGRPLAQDRHRRGGNPLSPELAP